MGWGLPREGVVAENFVPALESLSSLGFEQRNLGCPGNFAGCPGPLGVFKKLVQKKFVCIFRSLEGSTPKNKDQRRRENTDDADTKTREMRKMLLTGFVVTGFVVTGFR